MFCDEVRCARHVPLLRRTGKSGHAHFTFDPLQTRPWMCFCAAVVKFSCDAMFALDFKSELRNLFNSKRSFMLWEVSWSLSLFPDFTASVPETASFEVLLTLFTIRCQKMSVHQTDLTLTYKEISWWLTVSCWDTAYLGAKKRHWLDVFCQLWQITITKIWQSKWINICIDVEVMQLACSWPCLWAGSSENGSLVVLDSPTLPCHIHVSGWVSTVGTLHVTYWNILCLQGDVQLHFYSAMSSWFIGGDPWPVLYHNSTTTRVTCCLEWNIWVDLTSEIVFILVCDTISN